MEVDQIDPTIMLSITTHDYMNRYKEGT